MRKILSIITLLISGLLVKGQDTTYDTRSVHYLEHDYNIVFKYINNPDSVRTAVRKVRMPKKFDPAGITSLGDTLVNDTIKIKFFHSKAMLYELIDGVYQAVTDWQNAPFVLSDNDSFLNRVYVALIKRATDLNLIHNEKGGPMTGVFYRPPPMETEAGHTPHYKYATQRGDKSLWMSAGENFGSSGDTIVLRASLGPWSYGYINVTYPSNVVVWEEGSQTVFTSGVSIDNTQHLSFLGLGGDSTYGISITGGGTNMTIVGKSDFIEVGYIDMRNGGVGALWDKTEVSDVQNKYGCNLSYLTDTATYHHLHHIRIRHTQGDAVYFMSTGGDGNRPMTCGGVTTFPIPPGASHAELDHFIIDSSNRTGIQMSLTFGGGNSLHDNTITNQGYEYNTSQGAGLALGSKDDSIDVYNNVVNHTFIYNFYTYAKHPKVYNNTFDSAGRVGKTGTTGSRINSQQIPSALASATQSGSTIDFENNTIGFNSAVPSTQLVIYDATPALLTVSGNKACHTGAHVQNNTTRVFDTTCSVAVNLPPVVIPGSNKTLLLPVNTTPLSATVTDDGGTYTVLWTRLTGTGIITNGTTLTPTISGLLIGLSTFRITATDVQGLQSMATINVNVTSITHTPPSVNANIDDSIQGPLVSSYQLKGIVTAPNIRYGALFQHTTLAGKILAGTNIGVRSERTEVTFQGNWNGTNSPTVDSFVKHKLFVTLNINDAVPNDTVHFSTTANNLPLWTSRCSTLIAHINKDSVIIFNHNEEANANYRHITDTSDLAPYLVLSTSLISTAHARGIKVGNGGFQLNDLVFGTYYWLAATNNPDTVNFLNYCIPYTLRTGVLNRSNAFINQRVVYIKYLLSHFDATGFDYVNMHLYIPTSISLSDTSTAWSASYTGIAQMKNFIRSYTSKPLVSNEFGMMVDSIPVLNQVVTDLKAAGILLVDYYSDTTANVKYLVNSNNVTTSFGTTMSAVINEADDNTPVTKLWSEISGPPYTINNPAIDSPIVSALVPGDYFFRYSITDSLNSTAFDDMHLKVKTFVVNIPPVANAGPNVLSLDTSAIITLDGTASYDPEHGPLTYLWTQITGATTTFLGSTTAVQVQVNGFHAGTYVYQLTVTDNQGATGTDTITITVAPNVGIIYTSSKIKVKP